MEIETRQPRETSRLNQIPEDFAPSQPLLFRKLLWNRGLRTTEEAEKFLFPSLSDIPSPFGALKDLEIALDLLLKARETQERVVVFGDYDVDGTTACSLLVSLLHEWGWNVSYFVPHRVNQGYGVTLKAAKALISREKDVKYVVTCDCGVASFDGIEFLEKSGIAVVVTDHHEVPPSRVSARAVLNPKQKDCHYPDKKLAGVGVAFLLLIALRRALDFRSFSLAPYLDLVAIGTVCDVAELQGANRVFVKLGLQKLESTERLGLQVLLRNLSLTGRKMRATDLGFIIGPRLNAVGRVGEPDIGVRTLLSRNADEAQELVSLLESHNQQRRRLQDEQLELALRIAVRQIEKNPRRKTLVIAHPEFHLGIVGLIAARLAEKFQRPSCVLAELVDEHELVNFQHTLSVTKLWKGSLRTPVGFHLARALEEIRQFSPGLLRSGGGHALAAGVAVDDGRVLEFENVFEACISSQQKSEVVIEADAALHEIYGFETELFERLEPFGNGNPQPLFRMDAFSIERVQVMKDIHLKLHGRFRGQSWSILQFKSSWVRLFSELNGRKLSIDSLVTLSENEWNGTKKLELLLKELLEVRVSGERFEFTSFGSSSRGEAFASSSPSSNEVLQS